MTKQENFDERVADITTGRGVEVVYDSIGKDTFEGSLACLKTRGHMVSFRQSSGTRRPPTVISTCSNIHVLDRALSHPIHSQMRRVT
ncbi:hypothetical protein L1987_63984 [Smallanthus sonchifolius]|uniref:Uncharacterized protein n=1 Tax=Smallanthus sonchifolius TaxID=185202 RepID=A0ACB9CEU7_9ASTR|nr:hypothetical protein L1987_63984 [Smallanthus sonchifolius]